MEKALEPKSNAANERETYSIGNNSYHLFKVKREDRDLTVDLFWGKTDFRQKLVKGEKGWETTRLSILKNGRYFFFEDIAEHGVVFDDFRWADEGGEELFLELPKGFPEVVRQVCLKAIQKRGW